STPCSIRGSAVAAPLRPPEIGAPFGAAAADDLPPSPVAAPVAAAPPRRHRRTQRRRSRGPAFWIALGWIGIVVGCAVLANVLPVADPIATDVAHKLATPSWAHLLGTD